MCTETTHACSQLETACAHDKSLCSSRMSHAAMRRTASWLRSVAHVAECVQTQVWLIQLCMYADVGVMVQETSSCRAGELRRLGVTPLLCGAATTPYAEALRERLRAAAQDAVIERRFLGPVELAEVCSSGVIVQT